MPIIAVLVLVLAGGGFFMMKGKGKKPKKPKVELGAIEPVPEFLVNLKGGVVYLRAELALHMAKGFEKKGVEENMPALRDTVITILTSKSLNDLSTNANKDKLRKELAKALNEVFKRNEHKEKPADEEEDDFDKKKKKKKKHSDDEEGSSKSHKSKDESDEEEEEIPEGMDGSGPVLKIYFTNFATQ